MSNPVDVVFPVGGQVVVDHQGDLLHVNATSKQVSGDQNPGGAAAELSHDHVLSFWSMSPCMADTVKSRWCIFSVSQSTFLLVLQKMTAWVMVRVSYRSHRVSNFHSSL